MDATHRPLKIPPEFGLYADKHGIFDLNKRLLEQLIVHKPDEPIQFLIDVLTKENDEVPNIIVLGPPASGKYTVGKMLAGRLRCVHLTMKGVLQEAEREVKASVEEKLKNKEPIPTELWVAAIKQRTSLFDCNRKGWVLSGFPQTREQAIAMQSEGVFAKHVILLEAADNVLIERATGKRVDPRTGDFYHINFDPPTDEEVAARLEVVPGNSEKDMICRLKEFRRNIFNLSLSYSKVLHNINVDQPVADVMSQAVEIVALPERSVAPRNPRIVLLGPPGSGKRTQATLLAAKYQVIAVDCGELVRKAVADQTKLSGMLKPYLDRKTNVPDTLILQLVKDRLNEDDCLTRGWVLFNYPKNRAQAEALDSAGLEPNRIVSLDVPNHVVIERLSSRRWDPVTGNRYHLVHDPPTDDRIAERLVQHPNSQEIYVQRKLATYGKTYDEIVDYYPKIQQVPAEQEIHTVFELIETAVVQPIPKVFD